MIQIALNSVSYSVNEIPDGSGGKVLTFTDPESKITVIVPLGPQEAKQIGSQLMIARASSLPQPTNGKQPFEVIGGGKS